MLGSDKSVAKAPARIIPPPAPKGNQYAKGNKGARGDFCTKALISQLHETVKRETVKYQYYEEKGKIKRREILSKEQHQKIHFIVEALLENAMKGETEAIKYVFDRIEGRPMANYPEGGPDKVTINFMLVDQRI